MATSGSISGTLTARDVCRMAILLIGGPLQNGEVTAEDGLTMTTILNFMLKSWQADGCNLWRLSDESLTLAADTATVTLDPRVLDVMEARYVGGTTYQRTLARWEWGEYRALPNKTASGLPTCFSLNKQRTEIYMTFWPVPTEEVEILYSGARVIDDVNDLDDEVDCPQEWIETVYTCLAERMIPIFNVDALSAPVAARVTARAAFLYDKLLAFDRPGSTYMKPMPSYLMNSWGGWTW